MRNAQKIVYFCLNEMQINLHGLKRNKTTVVKQKNKFGGCAPAIELCTFDTKIDGSPLILLGQVDAYIIINCTRT